MIRAVLLNLDAVVLQTERLKALSYVFALHDLEPSLDETTILETVREHSDDPAFALAGHFLHRFNLQEVLRDLMPSVNTVQPEQALARLRSQYYQAMLESPDLLRKHSWPDLPHLLQGVRVRGCLVALTASASCAWVQSVLSALGLAQAFDVVVTEDDISHTPPHPEAHLLASKLLRVPSTQCLAIEVDANYVQAALTADMNVVAVVPALAGLGAGNIKGTRTVSREQLVTLLSETLSKPTPDCPRSKE